MNIVEYRCELSFLTVTGSVSLSDKGTEVLDSGGSSFGGIPCGARADLGDYYNPVS